MLSRQKTCSHAKSRETKNCVGEGIRTLLALPACLRTQPNDQST
jgi:hypothetical protein